MLNDAKLIRLLGNKMIDNKHAFVVGLEKQEKRWERAEIFSLLTRHRLIYNIHYLAPIYFINFIVGRKDFVGSHTLSARI